MAPLLLNGLRALSGANRNMLAAMGTTMAYLLPT
jgi:hypothetical protein